MRLADSILDRIEAGDWKPGQMLPPIDVLRSQAGLRSRMPVTRVLRLLEERGVITRYPGLGYRVTVENSIPPREAAARRLLAALRLTWDGKYMISTLPDGRLEAWRRDGSSSVQAATAEGLRDAIAADWPLYAAGRAL